MINSKFEFINIFSWKISQNVGVYSQKEMMKRKKLLKEMSACKIKVNRYKMK